MLSMTRAAGSAERYAALGGGLAALGFALGAVAGEWAALIGAAVGEGIGVAIVVAFGAACRAVQGQQGAATE
jgi:hypothetical protein